MVLINLCFEDSIALKRNLTVKVGETLLNVYSIHELPFQCF